MKVRIPDARKQAEARAPAFDGVIRVGHSPDPDDAFMVWALHEGIVHADDFDIELVAMDIETLNKWAVLDQRLDTDASAAASYRGQRAPDVSALSAATFARVADKYWLLPHGSSFGDGYGPIVVTKDPDAPLTSVLCPGELTTAHAALHMAIPGVQCTHVAFDRILPAVQKGPALAGLLIHEGQLTWEKAGVHKRLDLGAWWKQESGLALPLGVNAMRKDLGRELGEDVNALLQASLETGLTMRKRALAYARSFGRGISETDADTFVKMYVNDMTRDMGARGVEAVNEFVKRARAAGVLPKTGARVDMAP